MMSSCSSLSEMLRQLTTGMEVNLSLSFNNDS